MTETDENERMCQWEFDLVELEKLLDESEQGLQLYINRMKDAMSNNGGNLILTSKIDQHYAEAIRKLENFIWNHDIDESGNASGEWLDSLNYICLRFSPAGTDFSALLEEFQDFDAKLEERRTLRKMLGKS